MLFILSGLCLFIISLDGLSIPIDPPIILQPNIINSTSRSLMNPTAHDDWPPAPFNVSYFNDEMVVKILTYGPDIPLKFAPQATIAFDAIIYQLINSRVETFHPSDSPLVNLEGLVLVQVVFVEDISAIKIAITLQVIRDLMDWAYTPRNIKAAKFGWKEPWKPLGGLAVQFKITG
ncbi:MAG: hypothetical protein Q9207_002585 [Kuettlingeria erythrocarpa]